MDPTSAAPTCVANATPLEQAMDGFATAFGHLVKVVDDGGLDDLDAHGLVGFLQDYESVRNAMAVVDHAAIHTATERDVPHLLCQRSMARVLTQALRVSAPDATRRVRAAEQLADNRRSMTGEPLAPLRPQLAAAQRRGQVTPEQVGVIDAALRQVDGRGFDPAEVEAGEQILVEAAQGLGPSDLRQVAQKVVDAIDPDGTLPDEQVQQDRRFFRLRRTADGSFRGEFRLTPQAGEKLRTVLDPLAAPRTTSFCVGDGEPANTNQTGGADATGEAGVASEAAAGSGEAGLKVTEPDPRSRGQRLHDAVEAVCDRLLRSSTLPDSGGTPATVILTIDADKLRSRTGVGYTSDGSSIPAQTVIDLADQADLAWCVKDSKGAVLTLGRSRRIATRAQTCALIARDGGCSFPGCDVAAEWCERHHIVPWVDGGATDMDNMTLVCGYHHANFAGSGWTCRLSADGLPAWIPPKWIDPQQRPIVHPRIRIRHWRPQDPLRRVTDQPTVAASGCTGASQSMV
jgi:hypothetical protein